MWVHFEVVTHAYAAACDFFSYPETVQFVISLTISPCLPPLQVECSLNERGLDPDGLSVWVGCAKFGMIFFSLEMGFI